MGGGAVIPSWWSEAAESIAASSSWPPPITFVCGPANCGKSTFSLHLLNTLLKRYKRVGYLDTDVGQPEFTAPGCQSLHIIHNKTLDLTILYIKNPVKCFFFGDINCKRDPKAYLKNIFCLYEYFREVYYRSCDVDDPVQTMLPLVINTSGWVKGTGYDMLVEMLRYTSPTHVVQIRISAESKNLPNGMFWLDRNQEGDANLLEIAAAQRDSSNQTILKQKDARLMRDARLIAYFRQCLPKELDISSYKELAHSFSFIPPYRVPLSKVKVMHLHCQVSDSETLHSLNATIVGLAISSSKPTSSGNCMPWCVGLGIVRAVDVSKDQLYVITPIPLCSLEKVDTILQGFIEIPTCLLQVQGCVSPYMSTNVLHKLDAPENIIHKQDWKNTY